MTRSDAEPSESPPMVALRQFAMRLPEAEEGTSCVNRAFRARNKAYAYIGMKEDTYKVMVKLDASLETAASLHAERPDNYQVGKHGWTTIRLPHDEFPPTGLLEGWIEESYRLLAHASLVAMLPEGGLTAAPAKKKPARKASRKRPVTKTGTAKKTARKKKT